MLALVVQTLSVTTPVFAMLLLGMVLKRLGAIDVAFINTASSLVFNATMPALLFLSIYNADLETALQPALLGYFLLANVAGFFLIWGWARWRVPRIDRGVYVQGAFRGNNGIVGLALATSLYGDLGLSLGGLLAGAVILIYNVFSAIVLAVYSPNGNTSPRAIAASVAKNPLVIGVLSAIPFAYWQVGLPQWLLTSTAYFAGMSLPLALICIGGSLSLSALRDGRRTAIGSSLMKMVWFPALFTALAWLLGFRGAELGVLFLYFASPTAAASYVMARAANANHQLASAIIVMTTLMAAITINLGILTLQSLGWI